MLGAEEAANIDVGVEQQCKLGMGFYTFPDGCMIGSVAVVVDPAVPQNNNNRCVVPADGVVGAAALMRGLW